MVAEISNPPGVTKALISSTERCTDAVHTGVILRAAGVNRLITVLSCPHGLTYALVSVSVAAVSGVNKNVQTESSHTGVVQLAIAGDVRTLISYDVAQIRLSWTVTLGFAMNQNTSAVVETLVVVTGIDRHRCCWFSRSGADVIARRIHI